MDRKLVMVGIIIALILVGVLIYYVTLPSPQQTPTVTNTTTATPPPSKYSIRWATSSTGSAGYAALVALANLVNKYSGGTIEITVIPTAGAVISTKELMKKNVEGSYTADNQLDEIKQWTKRFEGFKDQCKTIPLQFLWAYTLDLGLVVPETSTIKKWSDIQDKPVFTLPLAWDAGARFREALEAIGIVYNHVEIDLNMVGTALAKGDIVASGFYTTAGGNGAPSWVLQMELSAPLLLIVNPAPEELAKLKEAGLPIIEVPSEKITKLFKNIKLPEGQDKYIAVGLYYGFFLSPDVPEDVAYRIIKILSEHAAELAKLDPSYTALAEDFDGFIVKAIDANKDWPIHPGLAKYLKEKGLWKDYWIEGTPENVKKFMADLGCPTS